MDIDYLKALYEEDKEISYNESYEYKTKPHLGLLVSINKEIFVVPLTSPKQKHPYISNNSDRIEKIYDENGKFTGLLMIHKMIPVYENIIKKIKFGKNDKYTALLVQQYNFIKKNRSRIIGKINRHYKKTISNHRLKYDTNIAKDLEFLSSYIKRML
ncbi:type III toxin-antitoxin system ToxN/AbiQ family toxin [Mycoplasma anserisalpingitidis]|uniref:type III toxin-antitoxin system ToxN/AbiQ family toxin n=1 Tax=Mycoplasma anserisalpingitidis TaxID=519450 RepID=UPI0013C2BF73|nr:type III toxin-antitoxin system ToxN/AbiQ family toxin [Mycoplasma anserisalpingitidis]